MIVPTFTKCLQIRGGPCNKLSNVVHIPHLQSMCVLRGYGKGGGGGFNVVKQMYFITYC